MAKLDAKSIIDYIGNAPKKTPVKVFIKGDLAQIDFPKEIENFTEAHSGVIFGDWKDIEPFLKKIIKLRPTILKMMHEIQQFLYWTSKS